MVVAHLTQVGRQDYKTQARVAVAAVVRIQAMAAMAALAS
jgi:hypothetical protein